MSADLSDAAYLEMAARARIDGDIPHVLGALASISPATLERMAGLLNSSVFAELFRDGCPDCNGFGKAMTTNGLAICQSCKGQDF
jgi:hypothetical protein